MSNAIKIPENCILKFEAKWCGPCQTIKPFIEEMKGKYNTEIITIDADEHPDICQEYNVTKLPTFVFKYNGKVKLLIGTDKKNIEMEFFACQNNISNQIKDQTQNI